MFPCWLQESEQIIHSLHQLAARASPTHGLSTAHEATPARTHPGRRRHTAHWLEGDLRRRASVSHFFDLPAPAASLPKSTAVPRISTACCDCDPRGGGLAVCCPFCLLCFRLELVGLEVEGFFASSVVLSRMRVGCWLAAALHDTGAKWAWWVLCDGLSCSFGLRA